MSWEKSFEGKSAIVTGAGRGIGRAITKKLHQLGVTVFAISKNPDNLASLKIECPTVHPVAVDLGNWEATREAVEKLPVVDYLVNNAAIFKMGACLDASESDVDAMYNVNLKAVLNVSQVVAKKMIASGRPGSIVNVSSVAALKILPKACGYSVLKSGLDQLTRSMAVELAPFKIRVNSVNPGAVLTDMMIGASKDMGTDVDESLGPIIPYPQKIIGMDEVVFTTVFLLSDAAPMIIGSSLALDGGMCIA